MTQVDHVANVNLDMDGARIPSVPVSGCLYYIIIVLCVLFYV